MASDWDSGFLDTFSDTIQVPARTQSKVQHIAQDAAKDNTGRWSHWSAPVEIIPGAPATLSELHATLLSQKFIMHRALPPRQRMQLVSPALTLSL